MASLLYRLGRLSYRRRRLTAVGWVILLGVLGLGAANLSGPTSDAVTIPGTESWRALDVLAERFGTGSDAASARVVFTVPDGTTLADPEQRAAVQATVAELRRAPQVAAVDDPYQAGTIAADGRTGYATVSYPVGEAEVGAPAREALLAAGDAARAAGLGVEYSGEVTEGRRTPVPPRRSACWWPPSSCWSPSAPYWPPVCRC